MPKKNNQADLEYVSCNLCGSEKARHYIKIDGFKVVKCKNCSLVYVNPRLKQQSLHKIYTKKYYKNYAFHGDKSTLYGYMEYLKEKEFIVSTFKRRLAQIQKLSKKGRLLDIGCAYGFFIELARKRGWNVTGVEISKDTCQYAKNNLKLNVINKALEEAKFTNGAFDVVTMFDVVEHLPDPQKTVKEIKRILNPNGLIVVTTPNIGSLMAKILGKNWEEIKRIREHIYFFSKDTLRKMLEANGFEILRTETAGRYFSVESAIKRGKMYNRTLFALIEKFSNILNLNDKIIYVDPRYKITIYARKMEQLK